MGPEDMKRLLEQKEQELKTLRLRTGEQRNQIRHLRALQERATTCDRCVYSSADGCLPGYLVCEKHDGFRIGVRIDDFCSQGMAVES